MNAGVLENSAYHMALGIRQKSRLLARQAADAKMSGE
jgi:hypothetical protein